MGQPTPQEQRSFVANIRSLAPDSVTDGEAASFFSRFPPDELLRQVVALDSQEDIDAACLALNKVFATTIGAQALPGLLGQAAVALQQAPSSAPALHSLVLRQLPMMWQLQQPQETTQLIVELLLHSLQAQDVGVASQAEDTLLQVVAMDPRNMLPFLLTTQDPHAPAHSLRHLASAGEDPVTRLRALSTVIGIAALSEEAAAWVEASGLLEPILSGLKDRDDLLGGLAALALLEEGAGKLGPRMAQQVQALVMPHLEQLLLQGGEAMVRGAALKAAAALLAAASMQGPWVQPVLRGVRSLLQEDEAEPALLEGAMNAAAVLGGEMTGAEAMVHDFDIINGIASAAFTGQPRELRKHALHALASIAGAQRAQRDCRREAALLSDDGERGLKEAVVQASLSVAGAPSPAAAILNTLESEQDDEVRIALYRLCTALFLHEWMAGEVCGSWALLTRMLDASSEAGKAHANQWRHASLLALFSTVKAVAEPWSHAPGALQNGVGGEHAANGVSAQQAAMIAAAPRIQAVVAAGPHGIGSPDMFVATLGG